MKKRRSSKSKTKQSDNFNTESGVLKFVDNASDDKKSPNPTDKRQSADIVDIRKYAQEKSNGATGGALKQLDPIIRKISSESKKTDSDIAATKKILNINVLSIKRVSAAVSVLETRLGDLTEQHNKTFGMLGDLISKFDEFKKETKKEFEKINKESSNSGSDRGTGILDTISDIVDIASNKGDKKPKANANANAKVPAKATTVASGALKSLGSAAKLGAKTLPAVGGLISGITEYMEGGDLGRAIASGAGTILGGILGGVLGSALGPVGTAAGGIAGSMAGEELAKSGYDLIFGKKKPVESDAIKKAREDREKSSDSKSGTSVSSPSPGMTTTSAGTDQKPSATNTSGGGGPSTGAVGNMATLNAAMDEMNFTGDSQRAGLAAITVGESGFQSIAENMNYSAARAQEIFKYQPAGGWEAITSKGPEAVAEEVYGYKTKNRGAQGLGNDQPGDGWKYRGRGFIQITGKSNYAAISKAIGVDLIADPDAMLDPKIAAKAAIAFMQQRGSPANFEDQLRAVAGSQDSWSKKRDTYKKFMEEGTFKPGSGKNNQQTAASGSSDATATAVATPPTMAPEGTSAPNAVPVEKGVAMPGETFNKPVAGAGKDYSQGGAQGASDTPGTPGVNKGIAEKISSIESSFGKLNVTSGYRDPAQNKRVGGAKDSAHTRANAVDVTFSGDEVKTLKLVEIASKAGIGGIGVYKPGFVHLDTESRRVWGPDYTSNSIPKWAAGALQAHMSGQMGQYDATAAGTKSETSETGGAAGASGSAASLEGSLAELKTGLGNIGGINSKGMGATSQGISSTQTSKAQIPGPLGMATSVPGLGQTAGLLSNLIGSGSIPQSPMDMVSMFGSLVNAINKQDSNTRAPNPTFARDAYQNNNVPPALPSQKILSELFGMNTPPDYNPAG